MARRKKETHKGKARSGSSASFWTRQGVSRRTVLGAVGVAAVGAAGATWGLGLFDPVSAKAEITVYKSPRCGCCGGWVSHLRRNGYAVKVFHKDDLDAIKRKAGVTDNLASCHTAFVSSYAIEGHVPAASIDRLLAELPSVRGLAVPGMPGGSPGMESADKEPYAVLAFDNKGRTQLYDRY